MILKDAFKSYSATNLHEPNLKEYFVETESIKKIKNSSTICVISGLKGIGKTATFRNLTEFDKSTEIIVDISASKYALSLNSGDQRAITYSHEFEYEIAIEFLKKIVDDTKLHKRIKPLVLANAKKCVTTFVTDLKELGGRVNSISVLGCGLSLSDPKAKILTGIKGRENELEAIKTLKEICDNELRMRLVIDDPEEVFFSGINLDVQLLGGLWLAVANLNSLSKHFRAYLLLKTHIHDLILNNTADLDKFPNSHTKICWTKDSLKELIIQRLKYFQDIKELNVTNIFWNEQSQKDINKCYDFIFSNLRNGPRELITWLYSALEYNEERGKDYLDLESLKSTIGTLSKNSFQFFNASNSEEFQDIGSFVQIIFEGIENDEISKRDLTSRIRKIQQESKDYQNLERKNRWIQTTSSKKFTEIMFRIGAINLIVDGREIFPFMCEYTTDNLDRAEKIKLTPVFKHYLMNN